jgi:hypothetical protein
MADQGDFELFQGPAPKETGEMSDEQFRDQMKQTQAALAQLQKEEGKARGNDFKLAHILIHFLNQPEHTDLFLLISRAVAHNIPSELILAVISLIDKRASEEVKGYLKTLSAGEKPIKVTALTIPHNRSFQSLSPEQKTAIENWIGIINTVALKKPSRTLEGLIIIKRSDDPEQMYSTVREISPVFIQLSSFILRNYLSMQKVSFELSELQEFMEVIFIKLVKDLENLLKEQKHLK